MKHKVNVNIITKYFHIVGTKTKEGDFGDKGTVNWDQQIEPISNLGTEQRGIVTTEESSRIDQCQADKIVYK